MQANVPCPTSGTAEGVSEAADFEVSLKNEDAPLAQLGHDRGKRKTADARTDYDGVEGIRVFQ
jgi:hypothetical protein